MFGNLWCGGRISPCVRNKLSVNSLWFLNWTHNVNDAVCATLSQVCQTKR